MNAIHGRISHAAPAVTPCSPGDGPSLAEVIGTAQALTRQLLGAGRPEASVDAFLVQRRRDAAGE